MKGCLYLYYLESVWELNQVNGVFSGGELGNWNMESTSHKGNRPELVGGGVGPVLRGVVRGSVVRESEEGVTGDRRILGMGILFGESGQRFRGGWSQKLSPAERRKRSDGIFKEECEEGKIPS